MYEVKHVLSANGVDIYQAWEPVGDGFFEMKLDFGPGFRVYYAIQDRKIVFLLGGGSKTRQQNDIDQAKGLWKSYKVQQK